MAITERQTKVNRARARASITLQRNHEEEWNELLNQEYAAEGLTRRTEEKKS